jgi:hypothetical protein
MSHKAIYVLSNRGLERVDRDVPSYDQDNFVKGLRKGLATVYREVLLHLEDERKYSYTTRDSILLFVQHNVYADADLVRLCRIVGRVPDNHVVCVSDCEGICSIHKSLDSAQKVYDLGVAGNVTNINLHLEELQD